MGCLLSSSKNRGAAEGGCLGFLLGPIGLLIAALMPTIQTTPQVVYVNQSAPVASTPIVAPPRSPEEIERQRQATIARVAAAERAEQRLKGEIEKLKIQAAIHRDMRRQRQAEFAAYIFSFQWFKAWPDWFQAVFMGLGLAVVALVVVAFAIRMFS